MACFCLPSWFCLIMTDFKVCSLNVQGLGEQLKRREIFNWLRAKNYSIYLLQETHSADMGNGASNPCLPHIPPPAEELLSSSTTISLSNY